MKCKKLKPDKYDNIGYESINNCICGKQHDKLLVEYSIDKSEFMYLCPTLGRIFFNDIPERSLL